MASTARVADSAMDPIRWEMRGLEMRCHGASCWHSDLRREPSRFRSPPTLLPGDGRFGCGPSKVRPEAVDALAAAGRSWLGTSHRQAPVQDVVGAVRAGLRELFALPDGWEVVLGNGGSTAFWDVATFGLIERRSQHLVFGEFSSQVRRRRRRGHPTSTHPRSCAAEPGTHPAPVADVRRRCLRAAPTTRPRPA